MATLMQTANSSGETGRCDAKCYDAKTQNCHCCCGGRNHGVGREKAIQNIKDYCNEMIREWEERYPEDIFLVKNNLF